jgi:hypothetical protein
MPKISADVLKFNENRRSEIRALFWGVYELSNFGENLYKIPVSFVRIRAEKVMLFS